MSVGKSCPAAAELERFLLGQVDADQAEQLGRHLDECSSCVQTARVADTADDLVMAVQEAGRHAEESLAPALVSLINELSRLAPEAESATEEAIDWQQILEPPDHPSELGRLGGYRIIRVLGSGGMGVVFEARDTTLQRPVALKALKPVLAAEPAARERFLREARATAQLSHDHIVAVHQVSEERGIPFLTMPLLQGEALAQCLKRQGALPIAEVVRLGLEAAHGLAAAHRAGLVHRDIKPANLWLEADPRGGPSRLKILDFGLVRPGDGQGTLTAAGCIVGTPGYMAPEQVEGKPLDGRCDLFSLGCVVYEMLTGRPPFRGDGMLATLQAMATQEPASPLKLRPETPPALARLVLRLLAKAPADRPSSAQEVAEALQMLIGRQPVRRRRWPRWVAAGVVLAASLAIAAAQPAVYHFVTNRGELVVETEDADVEIIVRKLGEEVQIRDLKSGGKLILDAGTYRVELGGEHTDVELSDDQVTLSRGGRKIVRVSRKPPADSSTLQPLAVFAGHEREVWSVAFANDGLRFFSGSQDHTLRSWDAGRPEVPGKVVVELPESNVKCVAVSPDGRWLAYSGQDAVVHVLDGKTYRQRWALEEHDSEIRALSFCPDGQGLVSGDIHGRVLLWDLARGERVREFVGHTAPVLSVAVSPDGEQILTGAWDNTARLWDRTTGQRCATLPHPEIVWSVAFSPDGRQALTGSGGRYKGDLFPSRGNDYSLRLWDLTTSSPRAQVFAGHKHDVTAVAFVSGGRLLSASLDGTVRLWSSASGNLLARSGDNEPGLRCLAVAPDGRHFLTGGWDNATRLWKLPPLTP